MSYPNLNTFKTYTLTWLVALGIGLLLGNSNSSFAVEPMVGEPDDVEMWIDISENFDDEYTATNNIWAAFIAAWVATDGNMEVVVLDRNTFCISAHNGGCLSKAAQRKRDGAAGAGE